MVTIDRKRLKELLSVEEMRFHQEHQKSYELYQRARKSLHGGVPMLWMIRWAGTFPIFVKEGKGAHFVDVDGNEYIDFCLGDTGAMTGHAPEKTVDAIYQQAKKGITLYAAHRRCYLGGRRAAKTIWFTLLAIYTYCNRCKSVCHSYGKGDHSTEIYPRIQLLLSWNS